MGNFCTNCSAEIDADDQFCGECGAKAEVTEPSRKQTVTGQLDPQAVDYDKKNTLFYPTMIFLACFSVFIIVVLVILTWLFRFAPGVQEFFYYFGYESNLGVLEITYFGLYLDPVITALGLLASIYLALRPTNVRMSTIGIIALPILGTLSRIAYNIFDFNIIILQTVDYWTRYYVKTSIFGGSYLEIVMSDLIYIALISVIFYILLVNATTKTLLFIMNRWA